MSLGYVGKLCRLPNPSRLPEFDCTSSGINAPSRLANWWNLTIVGGAEGKEGDATFFSLSLHFESRKAAAAGRFRPCKGEGGGGRRRRRPATAKSFISLLLRSQVIPSDKPFKINQPVSFFFPPPLSLRRKKERLTKCNEVGRREEDIQMGGRTVRRKEEEQEEKEKEKKKHKEKTKSASASAHRSPLLMSKISPQKPMYIIRGGGGEGGGYKFSFLSPKPPPPPPPPIGPSLISALEKKKKGRRRPDLSSINESACLPRKFRCRRLLLLLSFFFPQKTFFVRPGGRTLAQ